MEIKFEKEVCDFLALPSIPVKEWNGRDSFKFGVAITQLVLGGTAYAVCTFDAEKDKEPRIKKVFSQERFDAVKKIFVVPSYMNTEDIQKADLDEQSKKAAERLAQETKEMAEIPEGEAEIAMPENPYFFDNIHNDEEAIAFIMAYNKHNGIRGNAPTKHDTIMMRLAVIHAELNKNVNKNV